MSFNFSRFHNISEIAMRFNQSHPKIPKTGKWLLRFIIMHGVFTFTFLLIIYSTIFHDIKDKRYTQASENTIVCVIYCVFTFCYCMMLLHQDSLIFLINEMQKDYAIATSLSLQEQAMLLGYAERGSWNIKMWIVIALGVALTFPITSISLMIYYAFTDQFRLVPVYEITYPPILEENRDSLISFIILYIAMLWYCFYAASMYVGLVPLGPIFILHACGQLELVRNKIKSLFSDQLYNSDDIHKKLKLIVQHLQNIYSFVEHIQASFMLIYEFCLKGVSLLLPLLLYELIETVKEGQFNIEFFIIAIGTIVIAGVPCFYSDLLLELGESVKLAIYYSGWECRWDRRARSTLLLIMIRCTRPVAIRSLFRNMCLEALTDVMNQAYTIFNLINAAW